MNIQFECSCGKRLSFHPREAGQTFYCPRCEKKVSVPLIGEAQSQDSDPPTGKAMNRTIAGAETRQYPSSARAPSSISPPKTQGKNRTRADRQRGLPPVVQGFKTKPEESTPPPERTRTTLWQMWVESFRFPLKNDGKWTILVWVVLYGLLHSFLQYTPQMMTILLIGNSMVLRTILFVLMTLTPVALLFLLAYLAHYFLQVLRSAAAGEPQLPRVNEGDGIVRDLIIWNCTCIIGLCPLVAVLVGKVVLEWEFADWMVWSIIAWAVFYTPMALLMVTVFDTLLGLNPLFVFRSILRVPREYFLTTVAVWLVVFAELLLIVWMPEVPLLSQLLQWAIGLYGCMVSLHLLGTIAWHRREELAWFRTDPV